MNEKPKFQQIWGFRRNADLSSDDSKSNSDVRRAQEKLRLVPSLLSPETDRVSETNDRTQVQVEKKAKRVCNAPKKEKEKEKEKKKREVKSKPKKVSAVASKGVNGRRTKKSKLISQMTVFDDFRVFTESILDDLRVARETMFAKMRKEMDQLITSKKQPSRLSKKKTNKPKPNQDENQKAARSRKMKTTQAKPKQKPELAASKDPQEHAKDENSKEKNPILVESSAKRPIFTNASNQMVTSSSSYLSLPMVLSNDTSMKLERGNYSGIQGEERFGSFGESSCVGNGNGNGNGNGYPVGLNHHQRFDSFGIPSRVFSQDGSLLGARMMNGGGMRYGAAAAAGLANHHLASNTFRSLYPN